MAQTKAGSKKKAPKPSEVKSVEKKAKKALANAEKSVKAARKAVSHSKQKLRKKALELSKQTEKLAAKHATARVQLAAEKDKADAETQSAAKPSRAAPPQTSEGAGASPSSRRRTSPTLNELRGRARAQKIPGYSRMLRSDLIAALEASQQA